MIYSKGKEIVSIYSKGHYVSAVYKYIEGAWRVVWQAISSCFGSGYWAGDMPWKGTDAWKGF